MIIRRRVAITGVFLSVIPLVTKVAGKWYHPMQTKVKGRIEESKG